MVMMMVMIVMKLMIVSPKLILGQLAFLINLCLGEQIFMGKGEGFPVSRVALIFPK